MIKTPVLIPSLDSSSGLALNSYARRPGFTSRQEPSDFCICSLGQKICYFTFLNKKLSHCLIGIYHSCMKGRRPLYSDATSLDKFRHVYTGCLQRSHNFFLYLCNFQDFIHYFHSNCTCFFDCTTFSSYVLGSLQLFQGVGMGEAWGYSLIFHHPCVFWLVIFVSLWQAKKNSYHLKFKSHAISH